MQRAAPTDEVFRESTSPTESDTWGHRLAQIPYFFREPAIWLLKVLEAGYQPNRVKELGWRVSDLDSVRALKANAFLAGSNWETCSVGEVEHTHS